MSNKAWSWKWGCCCQKSAPSSSAAPSGIITQCCIGTGLPTTLYATIAMSGCIACPGTHSLTIPIVSDGIDHGPFSGFFWTAFIPSGGICGDQTSVTVRCVSPAGYNSVGLRCDGVRNTAYAWMATIGLGSISGTCESGQGLQYFCLSGSCSPVLLSASGGYLFTRDIAFGFVTCQCSNYTITVTE